MKKYLAIITPYGETFDSLKRGFVSGDIELIKISRIEDIRGRKFIGFLEMYNAREISGLHKLMNELQGRIIQSQEK